MRSQSTSATRSAAMFLDRGVLRRQPGGHARVGGEVGVEQRLRLGGGRGRAGERQAAAQSGGALPVDDPEVDRLGPGPQLGPAVRVGLGQRGHVDAEHALGRGHVHVDARRERPPQRLVAGHLRQPAQLRLARRPRGRTPGPARSGRR